MSLVVNERTRSREGRGLWGVRFVGSVGETLIDLR